MNTSLSPCAHMMMNGIATTLALVARAGDVLKGRERETGAGACVPVLGAQGPIA